jgi:cell division septal protein FtsQ
LAFKPQSLREFLWRTTVSKIKARRQERRRKKRQRNIFIILVAGGLLLLAAGITFAKSAWNNRADQSLVEVSGQPSLKVDQELIDYGEVKLNTNLTFDLQLTNVGDQTLEISEPPYVEVKEGC